MKLGKATRRAVLVTGLAALAAPAVAAPELDAFVVGQMTTAGIPGLALGLAREGAVRLARGYGVADLDTRRPVTADTPFHIASITKTITATAVMQLIEQGRLSLDEPVAPHLDFPMANPHHPDAPITVRQLLTHVSSLSDAHYYEVDFRTRGRDATQPLGAFLRDYLAPGGPHYSADGSFSAEPPGAAWHYSNVGYALLGYIVERVTGEDLRVATQRRIFAPLGMSHTRWTLAGPPAATPYDATDSGPSAVMPVGFPDYPVGMMRASAGELVRFVGAAANGGRALGRRILSEAAQGEMLRMAQPAGLPTWLAGQGLGWQASPLAGTVRPNHWGGDPGVFAVAYLDPATRSGVVVLTNLTATAQAKAAVQVIAARLLAL